MRTLPLLIIVFAVAVAACTTAPTKQGHLPLPRVGVRKQLDHYEFYEKDSGNRFVPQGINWVRLAKSEDKWPANISFSEDFYPAHSQEISSALQKMGKLGYNIVRVRIDAKGITGPQERVELNAKYINNLIDFIRVANQQGLYVLLTGQWMPDNYYQVANIGPASKANDQATGINQLLLSKSLIHAFAQYESDLVRMIKANTPELVSGIFAFDLWNEQSFSAKDLPFSKVNGTFISDDGKKYDLSQPDSRQQLADDATIEWVNSVTSAIKDVEPEMLVTSSVFTPLEVKRKGYDGVYVSGSAWGDWRQPFRLKTLENTKLDYLQIHPYPHASDYQIGPDLESLEFATLRKAKPVIIGEFGAHKKDFPDIATASSTMKSFLLQACSRGMAGWLFWSWDTYQQNRKNDLWNMTDSNSAIAETLSPRDLNWCTAPM